MSFTFHAASGLWCFLSTTLKPKRARAWKDSLTISLQLIQPPVAPLAAQESKQARGGLDGPAGLASIYTGRCLSLLL